MPPTFAPAAPGSRVTSYPVEPPEGRVVAAGTQLGATVSLRLEDYPDQDFRNAVGEYLASYFDPVRKGPDVETTGEGPWYIEGTAGGSLRESWPNPAALREDILDTILGHAGFFGLRATYDAQSRARAVGLGMLTAPRTVTVAEPPPDETFLEQLSEELPAAAGKSFGGIAAGVGKAAGTTAGGLASGLGSGLGVVGVLVVLAIVALGVVLLIVAFRAGWL